MFNRLPVDLGDCWKVRKGEHKHIDPPVAAYGNPLNEGEKLLVFMLFGFESDSLTDARRRKVQQVFEILDDATELIDRLGGLMRKVDPHKIAAAIAKLTETGMSLSPVAPYAGLVPIVESLTELLMDLVGEEMLGPVQYVVVGDSPFAHKDLSEHPAPKNASHVCPLREPVIMTLRTLVNGATAKQLDVEVVLDISE